MNREIELTEKEVKLLERILSDDYLDQSIYSNNDEILVGNSILSKLEKE